MNKRLFGLAIASAVFLLLFASLSSAYYYYGGYNSPYYNDYDSYTYYSSRNNNGYVRTTDYDRTTQKYVVGNRLVSRTTYVRETSEGYDHYGPYGGGYYQPTSYYRDSYMYPSYYNRNNYYLDYRPIYYSYRY
ncbi:MAG: hypothetical protein ABIH92_02775 [Nanoarchaeota archaeon]